ncbi:MAG TPA: MscL family protein [Verrucomicrobiae bacterium]|jgi:large-conductance mechanosensitive channel|nr:MscL family protein [Verrucomicrobiae bacterium]
MAARPRNRNTKTSTTRSVTAGTTVRFQQPKSTRKPKPKTVSVVAHEINPAAGFVNFLREHAVVALAIGFVIATQVQALVKQLVSSFIDPLFKLLFGEALSQRTFTLHWHTRAANFGWGSFVYGLLDFIFVLAAIYFIVKFFNLDKLDRPKK